MSEQPHSYPYDIDADLTLRAIESAWLAGRDDPQLSEAYEQILRELYPNLFEPEQP